MTKKILPRQQPNQNNHLFVVPPLQQDSLSCSLSVMAGSDLIHVTLVVRDDPGDKVKPSVKLYCAKVPQKQMWIVEALADKTATLWFNEDCLPKEATPGEIFKHLTGAEKWQQLPQLEGLFGVFQLHKKWKPISNTTVIYHVHRSQQ